MIQSDMSELKNEQELSELDAHTLTMLDKYRLHSNDTGSPYYLVIVLTHRIKTLTKDHTSKHKKDHSAKRAVVRMVAQRKTCQKYMQKNRKYRANYSAFIADLGLRG